MYNLTGEGQRTYIYTIYVDETRLIESVKIAMSPFGKLYSQRLYPFTPKNEYGIHARLSEWEDQHKTVCHSQWFYAQKCQL